MKVLLILALSIQLFGFNFMTSKEALKENKQVLCIGGYKFATTSTAYGVVMQQIFSKPSSINYPPQPIKCKKDG